jgi:hypothetical protein
MRHRAGTSESRQRLGNGTLGLLIVYLPLGQSNSSIGIIRTGWDLCSYNDISQLLLNAMFLLTSVIMSQQYMTSNTVASNYKAGSSCPVNSYYAEIRMRAQKTLGLSISLYIYLISIHMCWIVFVPGGCMLSFC